MPDGMEIGKIKDAIHTLWVVVARRKI